MVIIVQEQPHKVFKRKGADLLIEKEITLLQALTGVDFVVTHLDGSKLRIQNTPGEVIKPDDIKTVPEKGLPFHRSPYKFGNLYIVFKVAFPKTMPKAQLPNIAMALASQKTADVEMTAEETVLLKAYEEKDRNTHATGGQQAADSDEEEDDGRAQGGQRVQCA